MEAKRENRNKCFNVVSKNNSYSERFLSATSNHDTEVLMNEFWDFEEAKTTTINTNA